MRDAVPPIIALSFFINWSVLDMTPFSILAGIVIFVCGQIALGTFSFLLSCVSFFIGEAENIRGLSMSFDDLNKIPFEGQNFYVKNVFTTIIPTILGGVLSTSVILNKSDMTIGLITAISTAIFFLIVKKIVWEKGLRAYSGAS